MASDLLGLFLEAAFDKPIVYGAHDCQLFPADWVFAVKGIDPAAHWRGLYNGPIAAGRRLKRFGGLKAVASAAMQHSGLQVAREFQMGDVGLIRAVTDTDANPALAGIVGGICLGRNFWVSLSPAGLLEGRADCVIAWSVGYRT